MKIVIVSNGHGEDIIGATLAGELAALGYTIEALPTVGKGMAYAQTGFTALGPRLEMPSGGFVIDRPGILWEDFRAGFFSMTLEQYRALGRASRDSGATLVVGDIYGLGVGSVFGKRPLFQMQPLVSIRAWGGLSWDTRKRYLLLERLMMQRAAQVYVRDLESQDWLRQRGVKQAVFLGNPMLDALGGVELGLPPPYLLLLPGSRNDAYQSLPIMMEASRLLGSTGLTPVVAWAGLPLEKLEVLGWKREVERVGEQGEAKRRLRSEVQASSRGAGEETNKTEGLIERWTHPDGTVVYLTRGAFKAALMGAKLALSTSGTAAEQAAGFGIPVISFPTDGPQYTPVFAENQKRLLREALFLTKPDPQEVARVALEVLASPELQEKARAAGKAAMGEPGAARRIAMDIHERLELAGGGKL